MYLSFYVITFLYIGVTGENNEWFIFSPDKTSLADCIKNYLSNNNHQYERDGVAEKIAPLASRRFFEKTLSNKVFKLRLRRFFKDLRSKKLASELNRDQVSAQLQIDMFQALKICSAENIAEAVVPSAKAENTDISKTEGHFIFNPDREILAECIENQFSVIAPKYVQNGISKVFANLAAKRFYGKIIYKKNFRGRVRYFVHDLRTYRNHMSNLVDNEEFRSLIREVLKKCATENGSTTTPKIVLKYEKLKKSRRVVAGPDAEYLFLSPDKTLFARCIENFISNTDQQYAQNKVAKVISDLTARRFSGKSATKQVFSLRVNQFFSELRHKKISCNVSTDLISDELRSVLKLAMQACAINSSITAADSILKDEQSDSSYVTKIDQYKDHIVFIPDEAILSNCIKNNLLVCDRNYLLHEIAEEVANLTARSYCGRTKTKRSFTKKFNSFFTEFLIEKISHKIKSDQIYFALEDNLKKALLDCALRNITMIQLQMISKKVLNFCNGKNSTEINSNAAAALPPFDGDSPEVANVLDYILVTWPFDLSNAIQTRSGRALLRKYASDALMVLILALKTQISHESFRISLRVSWIRRAQAFYDSNANKMPYIFHRYTLNDPRPHIEEDSNDFVNQYAEVSSNGNLPVPSTLEKILSIHDADRPGYSGEFDIYVSYINNGMTHAEYYIENQIDTFYRILFFFLELKANGIASDENDIYDGPLPYDIIPKQIQDIVYNDEAYRKYLLDERSFYELILDGTQNEIRFNLLRTARVYEEDLIMLRMNTPSTSGVRSSNKTLSTTDTTGTIVNTSQSFKRKGTYFLNESGKSFIKRSKTESNGENYGFVVTTVNDFEELEFSPDFIKILSSDLQAESFET